MDYQFTRGVRVVGWLHVVTGATMLIAPFFAFQAADAYQGAAWLMPHLWLLALGCVVLGTGVGLLKRAPWAWGLALLIALSGAAVSAGRLWFGPPAEGLVVVLMTNVFVLAVLISARRRGGAGLPPRDPA